MRILIRKASDYSNKEIRENQTAQDILKIIEEFNESIVIDKGGVYYSEERDENGHFSKDENFDYTIVIYDDYIE
jgi:phage pi2 protein 07